MLFWSWGASASQGDDNIRSFRYLNPALHGRCVTKYDGWVQNHFEFLLYSMMLQPQLPSITIFRMFWTTFSLAEATNPMRPSAATGIRSSRAMSMAGGDDLVSWQLEQPPPRILNCNTSRPTRCQIRPGESVPWQSRHLPKARYFCLPYSIIFITVLFHTCFRMFSNIQIYSMYYSPLWDNLYHVVEPQKVWVIMIEYWSLRFSAITHTWCIPQIHGLGQRKKKLAKACLCDWSSMDCWS